MPVGVGYAELGEFVVPFVKKRLVTALAATIVLILGLPVGAGAARPAPAPIEPAVVIAENGVVQPDGRTFYPTGPISDTTQVILPDASGRLPGGPQPQ